MLTARHIEPMSLLECVMARPRLYTKHGTVDEVLAFLAGYQAGLRAHSSKRRRRSELEVAVVELDAFVRWLYEQADVQQNDDLLQPDRVADGLTSRFVDAEEFCGKARAVLKGFAKDHI